MFPRLTDKVGEVKGNMDARGVDEAVHANKKSPERIVKLPLGDFDEEERKLF